MQIEQIKLNRYKNSKDRRKKEGPDNKDLNKTLKGVLINNHVKTESDISFNDIQDSLLICNTPNSYIKSSLNNERKNSKGESAFNISKAIKPLLIGTGVLLGCCLGFSTILKNSSQTLLKSKNFEQLPDLAVNMNIKEEPQFAIYRAIRDPNFRNLLGAAAIFIMSGITIASKNFVDGAKEIWLKKKSADIEKKLQEDLIEVETGAFSGKLQVVNDMMANNMNYFDEVLNHTREKNSTPNVFAQFVAFKGQNNTKQTGLNEEGQSNQNKNKENEKRDLYKNIGYAVLTAGVLTAAAILGKISLSNIKKTAQNTQKYANNITERTIDVIKEKSNTPDKKDISQITELLKSICAKPEFIKETGKKYNLNETEIQSIMDAVAESKKTIFADAPTALGGIPKKIQYYCYIDENRGHLYNWILNPENKFTKYIFGAFTLSSAVGYVFKQTMDAVKEATVMNENAKTELDLRKRLVDVEIANFRAKKESAIKPLVDNFSLQASNGAKTKEELKQLADNILMETKNGPPYVYT